MNNHKGSKNYILSKMFLGEARFWLAFFGLLTSATLITEHFDEKNGALKRLFLNPESVTNPTSFLKEKGWDAYEAERYEPCLSELKKGFIAKPIITYTF